MKRISFPSLGFLDSRYVNVTGDSMTGPLWIETGESTLFIVGNTDFEKYVAFYIPEAGFAHPMTLEIYAASDVRFSLSNDIDTFNWQYKLIDNAWELSSASQSITLASGGDLNLDPSGDVVIKANFIPTAFSAIDLGSPSRYFTNAYIDKLYLNSTASLDGATAGIISIVGNVGIGTSSPDSAFHIKAVVPGVVGSHSAGQLIIQSPTDSVFSNVVITAYESDGDGNPDQQLWYLGSSSTGNTDITFLNRRNAKLALGTNNTSRITILGNGNVGIGTTGPDAKLDIHGDTRLGDSDDGNYLNVSSTGIVTLAGTAKRWLAIRPDLDYTVITAQGKPTQVVVGVFHGYSMPVYIAAQNEELFFNIHVPGRWDGASNPIVHLLVALAGAEDVNDNFKFQVSWEHLTEGDVIPVTSHDVEVEQAVLTGRTAQYSTYELHFALDYDVDDPDDLADHDDLAFRLRRIDATNPDITNEIIVLDYHVEFQVDKMFDGDAV